MGPGRTLPPQKHAKPVITGFSDPGPEVRWSEQGRQKLLAFLCLGLGLHPMMSKKEIPIMNGTEYAKGPPKVLLD